MTVVFITCHYVRRDQIKHIQLIQPVTHPPPSFLVEIEPTKLITKAANTLLMLCKLVYIYILFNIRSLLI